MVLKTHIYTVIVEISNMRIYIYMALDNLSKVKRQLWPSHFTIGHEALTSGARIIENYADLSNTSI